MEQYKSVVFYGPKGMGKTYLVRKLAACIQVCLLFIQIFVVLYKQLNCTESTKTQMNRLLFWFHHAKGNELLVSISGIGGPMKFF